VEEPGVAAPGGGVGTLQQARQLIEQPGLAEERFGGGPVSRQAQGLGEPVRRLVIGGVRLAGDPELTDRPRGIPVLQGDPAPEPRQRRVVGRAPGQQGLGPLRPVSFQSDPGPQGPRLDVRVRQRREHRLGVGRSTLAQQEPGQGQARRAIRGVGVEEPPQVQLLVAPLPLADRGGAPEQDILIGKPRHVGQGAVLFVQLEPARQDGVDIDQLATGLDRLRVERHGAPEGGLGRAGAMAAQLQLPLLEPGQRGHRVAVGDAPEVGQGLVDPAPRHRRLRPEHPVGGGRPPEPGQPRQRSLGPVHRAALEIGPRLMPEPVRVGRGPGQVGRQAERRGGQGRQAGPE